MIERKPERRSLPTPGDRRKRTEQPALHWEDVIPAIPGMIRPGAGEQVPAVERRSRPGCGDE